MSSETKELRCDMDADVMRALDALALTNDLDRTKYVVKVLTSHVKLEIHKLSLMQAMLKGNSLLAESERSAGV